RGQIVKFELEEVSIDLDAISLDEVLDFRQQHHKAHRQYMQDLRSFSLELSLLGEADRERAVADRREQLHEQAHDLRRRIVAAWKSPKDVAGFALGLGGAAWAAAAGNPVPAALALLGAGL